MKKLLIPLLVIMMILTCFPIISNATGSNGCAGTKIDEHMLKEFRMTSTSYTCSTSPDAKAFPYKITILFDNGTGTMVEQIVYLSEQPQISDVSINIQGGRVVVTGTNSDDISAWNILFKKYHTFIVGVSGLGAITALLAFVILFMKLGATAGNPQERQRVIVGILMSGVAASCLGSVTVVLGFFYNAI